MKTDIKKDSQSRLLLKEMYNNNQLPNIKVNISEDGSLALLAYGYRGLMEWRKKRKENFVEKGEDSYDK